MRTRALWWAMGALVLGGVALLITAASGIEPLWIDRAGSVAVVTGMSWMLANRIGGRAVIAAALALVLGILAAVMGGDILPTGASVLTCAVGGVLAVVMTVPSTSVLGGLREVFVATLIAMFTGLAVAGFEPTANVERFDFASLLAALVLVFTVAYRLGNGLLGLGPRGFVMVVVLFALLVALLLYAELLRRYGGLGLVDDVMRLVRWTRERIGAFPRPLVAVLGIPMLMWGTQVRARSRQGWWISAFGVAATVPMASVLVAPDGSFLEGGLRIAYSVVLGVLVGLLVTRVDAALSKPKGKRGRRAEERTALRPEPSRFSEL